MEKKLFLLGVALVVVGLCGSVTLALDPIGPPVAGCQQGQFSAGFEFAICEIDLEVSGPGISTANNRDAILEDVDSRKYFARIGYGLSDDWEIFTRI